MRDNPQSSPTLSPVVTPGLRPSAFQPPVFGGNDSQRLMRCNRKLLDLGINDTINVPQIVAIGDQSTGKSSLIEKISGIHVPKSTGLCTKCPIAINLNNTQHSAAAAWSCKVSVELKYFFQSSRKRISTNNPLGPWQPLPLICTKEIAIIENQTELLDTIRKAEEYVLTTRDETGTQLTELLETFSPNTIRVDVFCDCPNLSFVDLPGVIQTAVTVNGRALPKYNVDIVHSLASQYSKDPNNIMLLMIPMNHDIANIASFGIIREQYAQTRTVAVFTKPDRVLSDQQVEILREHFTEDTVHEFMGHHMVMLGDSAEFNEEEFFLQEPFSKSTEIVKNQFGIGRLTERLRDILFEKIQATLPGNLQKIESELIRVQTELQRMPAPPNAVELPYELKEHLLRFETVIKSTFGPSQQGEETVSCRSKILQSMEDFAKTIRGTGPTVALLTHHEKRRKNKAASLKRKNTEQSLPDETASNKSNVTTQSTTNAPNHTSFQLEDIRSINNRYVKNAMPGNIEAEAVDEMIRMSVKHWRRECEDLIQAVGTNINAHVISAIQNSFVHYVHLPLFSEVFQLATCFINRIFSEETGRLLLDCDAEQTYPFTLDDARMKQLDAAAFKLRKQRRDESRVELLNNEAKAEAKGKVKELTVNDLEADEWSTEIAMAARTRAYYELAGPRFIDSICQQMHARLIPRCERDLIPTLREQLGLNDISENRHRIISLMTEDPEREELRQRLSSRVERLEEGRTFIAESLQGAVTSTQNTPASRMRDLSIVSGSRTSPRKRIIEEELDESPTKRHRQLTHSRLATRSKSEETDSE